MNRFGYFLRRLDDAVFQCLHRQAATAPQRDARRFVLALAFLVLGLFFLALVVGRDA